MKLHSFPFYPDLVGQPIPGTDRKTTFRHSLLMGFIINCSQYGSEEYCFAGTKKLSDLLELHENNVRQFRSDLVKLGWITVEYGAKNRVVKMFPNLEAVVVKNGWCRENTTTPPSSCRENTTTPTPVLTPDGKNNYIKEHICVSSNAKPNEDPTFSLTGPDQENAGGVVKNTTPFEGTVADVKPKAKAGMITPKCFALANELMGIINPREKDVVSVAKNIKSLMVKGYTEEDLRQVARLSRSSSYYADKPCRVVLSAKGVEDLLAKTKGSNDEFADVRAVRHDPNGKIYKVLVSGEEVETDQDFAARFHTKVWQERVKDGTL